MISVCIATYNGEKYIHKQLKSIIDQIGINDEIIISDDSSNDATVPIIKSFHDKRIVLLESNKFKSPVFNIENALKKASGDVIFLADQDDIWLPHKISLTMPFFNIYDVVVCNGFIVDQYENIIKESYFSWRKSGHGFVKNLYKNTYLGCAMAFNRKILNKAIPFPKKIAMHDIWIGLIAEVYGKSYFMEESLFQYRRHNNNYTYSFEINDKNPSKNSLVFKFKYRFYFLYYLFRRIIFNK